MKSSKLTETLVFFKEETLEEQQEKAYKYFKEHIMLEANREKLKEKRIILKLDIDYLDGKEHCFEHLTGFDETDEKFEIDPCINSKEEEICLTKCSLDGVPSNQRVFCIYRAKCLNWFNQILRFANSDDVDTYVWIEKDKWNKDTLKLRFKHETVDYIMIFSILKDGNYKLITAYPIVKKGDRRKADRGYQNYKK